ncbi:MAG TPA: hypothetical protein VF184_00865 [Phycisphaeraceae bacterium]
MRHLLFLAIASSLGLAGLPGCDQQPDAQDQLSSAMHTLQAAERGYTDSNPENPEDLEAYRQRLMGQAAPELEQVAQNGTPQERVIALRLLADVDASAARRAGRDAAAEYAGIAARCTVLLSHLQAAERAAARAQAFTGTADALLEAFDKLSAQHKAELEDLKSRASELEAQIQSLTQQQEGVKAQASAAFARATDLDRQAFTAEGDAHYELADQASQARRQADRHAAEVEKLQARIDVLRAGLNLLEIERQQVEQSLQSVAQRAQQAQARQQEVQADLADAQTRRSQAAEALAQAFQTLHQDYQTRVDQPFDAAAQRIGRAVQRLEQAVNQASGRTRSVVEAQLLGQRVTQAHILTDQAMALGGLGRIVGTLAQRSEAIMPELAQQFHQVNEGLVAKQQALLASAREAIAAGQQLATQLASAGNEDDAALAQAQEQRLQNYDQRLAQAALQ